MRIFIYKINYFPELTGIGNYTEEMFEWMIVLNIMMSVSLQLCHITLNGKYLIHPTSIREPYFIFYFGSRFRDFLKIFGKQFPITSFRLSNMTTNNIHDLSIIQKTDSMLPVESNWSSEFNCLVKDLKNNNIQ